MQCYSVMVYAVIVCPSVCPSVCVFATSQFVPNRLNIESYDREVMQKLCAKLYVTWQWNLAGEERKWVGTSVGWSV